MTFETDGCREEEIAIMAYKHIVFPDDYEMLHVDGILMLLKALKTAGYHLGMIATTMVEEYGERDGFWELYHMFDCVLHDTSKGMDEELDGRRLKGYMQCYQVDRGDILFIGGSMTDIEYASAAEVDCGLALWACSRPRHVRASYYFSQPFDVWNQLNRKADPFQNLEWISMAMELQFIAQAGLTYTRDRFDQERFERIREISAQIMELGTGLPIEHVKQVFCNETGYQTPKLDTRAAVFQEDKILLVREKGSGLWSMPGGWVDVNQTIAGNTVKEVKEEAGLDVVPVRLIALHDRNQHNVPVYAYGICKAFMLCEVIGGEFIENMETDASGYFGLEELPPLSLDKTTVEQVQMCFEAYRNRHWLPVVD